MNNFSTKNKCNKYIFKSKKECINRKNIIYNKSRPNFNQTIYHIGTYHEFINITKLNEKSKEIYTFSYIFNFLKKGIYVSIKNNNLIHFLPFSNFNYINTFNLPKNINSLETSKFVEPNVNKWYANNCFFRNTYNPKNKLFDEGDKSIAIYLFFIINLCTNTKISDINFFINVRDFPILHKFGFNPYYSLRKNNNVIVNPNLCSPIFSQSINDEYLDILIPTEDDIIGSFKVIIPPTCKDTFFNNDISNWENKINIANFRGSATGCSVTELSNHRIQICILSIQYPNYIDAKLTSLNKRLKIDPDLSYTVINPERIVNKPLNIKIKDLLTNKLLSDNESKSYKYIINIDGHVAAFRLSRLLSFNSVILQIESKWIIWINSFLNGIYYENITPDNINSIHFLIVKTNKNTINSQHLFDTIDFLKNNDNIAKQIASNSINAYLKYVNTDFILTYTQNLFNSIR